LVLSLLIQKLKESSKGWEDYTMVPKRAYEGGCSCGKLRYRIIADPLIVHACHCRQCQHITGSAFVMNAVVEKSKVDILTGATSHFQFPSTSHTAYFCPDCATYVWSQYSTPGSCLGSCWFVRVGTLDDPDRHPPDVHIFTSSKQPWVVIPPETPRFDEYFTIRDVWQESSLARMEPYWRDLPNC